MKCVIIGYLVDRYSTAVKRGKILLNQPFYPWRTLATICWLRQIAQTVAIELPVRRIVVANLNGSINRTGD